MQHMKRNTEPDRCQTPDYLGLIPGEDNHSSLDIGQMSDAVSDRLQFLVPRLGLTPRLKALMAALKHARSIGPLAFPDARPQRLLQFLWHGAPVVVCTPYPPLPAPASPMPQPR